MQAKRQGRNQEARQILNGLVEAHPDHAPALNSLGLIELDDGKIARARELFTRAAEKDPKAPPIWLNLAEAHRAAGDADGELRALDSALSIEPYLLPALLKKAQAFERLGRVEDAVRIYRPLLRSVPYESLPEAAKRDLDRGRALVAAEGAQISRHLNDIVAPLRSAHSSEELARADLYLENVAGRRTIYTQQPTGSHFPFLPAFEYFDRALFPWFAQLEQATANITEELTALWQDPEAGFEPYVTFDATTPVNQWRELNHSPRWSVKYLWRDGVRQEEMVARCPRTARAVEALPLLDIPAKGPTVLFSILAPRTRIPPHTGTSNVRSTVHLPLIVPEGCGFRVGGDTREWRIGQAWAFDDTIEHEAWNESDKPRAILILDVWNPLLTEVEREIVRLAGG